MKIVLAIIVYTRHENIKRWLECWEQCDQIAELVVIHNTNGSAKVRDLCRGKVRYIARENKGMDIGAFKDVCTGNLTGFPDFDYLLWCTDDVFPMQKDFIKPYIEKFKKGVGVVCTDLSPYVKTHIRTAAFCISKECASKLEFGNIVTKNDCYQFEHLNKNAFYEQVLNMWLEVIQVSDRETSPIWDSGYHRRLNRSTEHIKAFAGKFKVTFICIIYNSYPQIISSLLLQTYEDWELLLIHDGPNETGLSELIPDDPRIKYIQTKTRLQQWGHPLRQWALGNLDELSPDSGYVVITNADNYHVPTYIEYMLSAFISSSGSVATYCENMVHSYIQWQVINCKMQLGYVDCAGVMVRSDIAKGVGWRDMSYSSDWTYFDDILKKYGRDKFTMVPGCLLVHN